MTGNRNRRSIRNEQRPGFPIKNVGNDGGGEKPQTFKQYTLSLDYPVVIALLHTYIAQRKTKHPNTYMHVPSPVLLLNRQLNRLHEMP